MNLTPLVSVKAFVIELLGRPRCIIRHILGVEHLIVCREITKEEAMLLNEAKLQFEITFEYIDTGLMQDGRPKYIDTLCTKIKTDIPLKQFWENI